MINLYPKVCNLCFGKVVYTSNAYIYGKEYGSGKCYRCLDCGAYVGTHKPRPNEALGLLANEPMRKGKMLCHEIFDSKWKGKSKAQKKRNDLYFWLSRQLDISVNDCHFGHFDLQTLRKAYRILLTIKDCDLIYDNKGRIINGAVLEYPGDGAMTKKQIYNDYVEDCKSGTCYYCSDGTKQYCNELRKKGVNLSDCKYYHELSSEKKEIVQRTT